MPSSHYDDQKVKLVGAHGFNFKLLSEDALVQLCNSLSVSINGLASPRPRICFKVVFLVIQEQHHQHSLGPLLLRFQKGVFANKVDVRVQLSSENLKTRQWAF